MSPLLRSLAAWTAIALCAAPSLAHASTDLRLTVNAIPPEQASVLVLPRSDFTVEVAHLVPGEVVAGSERLLAVGLGDYSRVVDLTADRIAGDSDSAIWQVSTANALLPGSWKLIAIADRSDGALATEVLPVAVRDPDLGFPLEQTQKVFLDFGADRDGDGTPDLLTDLVAFGLLEAEDAPEADTVVLWLTLDVLGRVEDFFAPPDPVGLPGPVDLPLEFSLSEPTGVHTRICVGGEDPGGGSVIGNVLFDAGNLNPADVACGDLVSTGVFPRELLYYAFSTTWQNAFVALQAQPIGSLGLDDWLTGAAYNPNQPAWQARFQIVSQGVYTLARAVASVTAHEVAHALGLVPPGNPGAGLYGGTSGLAQTHNLAVGGGVPSENWLMNQGSSFSFDELVGGAGVPLPRLRPLNIAYLRGRQVIDGQVMSIAPPPVVGGLAPASASLYGGGPLIVPVAVTGWDLGNAPRLRLLGPTQHTLTGVASAGPSLVTGYVQLLQLFPGTYDLELTNPDGQVSLLPGAFTLE